MDTDHEHIPARVINKLDHLSLLLSALDRDLPLFGPQKFSNVIKIIVGHIRSSFNEELAILETSHTGRERIPIRAAAYLSTIRDIHRALLPYLERTPSIEVPSELLFFANSLVAKEPEEFALSFLPTWSLTYETHILRQRLLCDQYLQPLLGSTMSSFSPPDPDLDWLIFISYPRMEARNALLHVMMVHELAHLRDYEDGVSGIVMEKLGNLNTSRLGQRISQYLYEHCATITENWISEVMCDLIATRVLGPAYFFGLHELGVLAGSEDVYSESHPSTALRLGYIFSELEHMGYRGAGLPEPLSKLVDACYGRLSQSFPPVDEALGIAYDSLTAGIQHLQEIARQIIRDDQAFTAGHLAPNFDQGNILVDDLCKGIVHCDSWASPDASIPNDTRVLLNSGWYVYLFRCDAFYSFLRAPDRASQSRALDNFNELILTAIEGCENLRRWKEGL